MTFTLTTCTYCTECGGSGAAGNTRGDGSAEALCSCCLGTGMHEDGDPDDADGELRHPTADEVALRLLKPGSVALVSGSGVVGLARHARRAGRPFRAPHHTVGEAGLLAELALSAGGVLLLDCVIEFPSIPFRHALGVWRRMDSLRPSLVLTVPWGNSEHERACTWRMLERTAEWLPRIDLHLHTEQLAHIAKQRRAAP